MNKLVLILSSLFVCLANTNILSQGCSDAGFCTMGAMKPDQKFEKKGNIKLRSVEVSHYYGLTRFKDKIFVYTADFGFAFGKKMQGQVKLPYQRTQGVLANKGGLSDISLSLTRNLVAKEKYQINATLGAKIPTGNPTKTDDQGRALPMYYQSTLGTFDVVAGISLATRGWLFAVGYQQALNKVDNKFVWGPFQGDPNEEEALRYPISPNLWRGKDVMLRMEKNVRFSKFNISLGLLSIYRLDKDKTQKANEVEVYAPDSNGLALTALVGGGYRLTPRSAIKIMNGFRIVKRHANPDGLSREFVNTIGYEFQF
jgi:hypothetical protein